MFLLLCALWCLHGVLSDVELRCGPTDCFPLGPYAEGVSFHLHSGEVSIGYEISHSRVDITCKNPLVLSSPEMPRFSGPVNVNSIALTSCQLPDAPLTTTLENLPARLNQPKLIALKMPAGSIITEKHFQGLDNLSALSINVASSQDPAVIYNIIHKFNNLTSLEITGMHLDVSLIPNSVTVLDITDATTTSPLSELFRELSFVKELALSRVHVNTSFPLSTDNENEDNNVVSNIEKVWLSHWEERQPSPMEHCENLRELYLISPEMDSLPENWIANCTQLEILEIYNAGNLATLAENVLKGAFRLKTFIMTGSKLTSLPSGLLDDARALWYLTIKDRELETIPHKFFKGAVNIKKYYLEMEGHTSSYTTSRRSITDDTGDTCLLPV